LEAIGLADVASEGYCFQVDLTRRVVRAGMVVREVPITFVEREVGVSKMSPAVARESLRNITAWGLSYRAGQVQDLLVGRDRWHELET
jgi:dolichol-phosphate mannosyltransferase